MNKVEFIKSFFPERVKDVNFVALDLDSTDLSIADILRNINRTFPANTRGRNNIISGETVVAVLCKSELLDPLSGIMLIVCDDSSDFNILSKDYMVLAISEEMIKDNESVFDVIQNITSYLVKFRDVLPNFNKFYTKFVYDEYELHRTSED